MPQQLEPTCCASQLTHCTVNRCTASSSGVRSGGVCDTGRGLSSHCRAWRDAGMCVLPLDCGNFHPGGSKCPLFTPEPLPSLTRHKPAQSAKASSTFLVCQISSMPLPFLRVLYLDLHPSPLCRLAPNSRFFGSPAAGRAQHHGAARPGIKPSFGCAPRRRRLPADAPHPLQR